jgi:hypothetical protein
MKNIPVLIILSAALAACAPEATKEQLAQNLSLPTQDKTIESRLPAQMIEIYPNQKLFVEVVVADGKVIQVIPVAEIKNPGITLTLTFKAMDKGMILSVENPLPNYLKYNIDMIDRSGKSYPTSSCPVMKGGAVFENWPHPIPKLQIKNFRLLDNEKDLTCVY